MSNSDVVRIPRHATFPTLGGVPHVSVFAEAYYQAASTLWQRVKKSNGIPYPDSLVFPILFLLHQAFELMLKEIIRASCSIGSLTSKAALIPPNPDHGLGALMGHADSNLKDLGICERLPLDQASRELIEDIDEFGNKSFALRYPFDKNWVPYLPHTYVADVAAVMSRAAEAWDELTGVGGELIEREQFYLNEV